MKRQLLIAATVLLVACGAAFAQQAVIVSPTPSLGYGIIPSFQTATAASLVIKPTAGNLYSASVTSLTSGFLMLFNSATVPTDGSVAPTDCIAVASNSSASINFAPGPPETFTAGIVAAYSSTGCFSKTTLTPQFLKALAR